MLTKINENNLKNARCKKIYFKNQNLTDIGDFVGNNLVDNGKSLFLFYHIITTYYFNFHLTTLFDNIEFSIGILIIITYLINRHFLKAGLEYFKILNVFMF